MSLLKAILAEKADPKSVDPKVEAQRPYADKICKLVFKEPGDWIADKKRSPERKYYGVSNKIAVVFDPDGNHLKMTFDNSTDSGEWELNSFTPLMIVKGSPLDLEIRKLFSEHEVRSSKKVGYIERNGQTVIREVHFGKTLDERSIRLAMDLIANIKSEFKRTKLRESIEHKYTKCLVWQNEEDAARIKELALKRDGLDLTVDMNVMYFDAKPDFDHIVYHYVSKTMPDRKPELKLVADLKPADFQKRA